MVDKKSDPRKSIARGAFYAAWMQSKEMSGFSIGETVLVDSAFEKWWAEVSGK